MRKIGLVLITGMVLGVCAYLAQAESSLQPLIVPANYGSIKGTVTDPDSLVDAAISVESELILGAEVRVTTTDASGNYEFIGLPPGEYIVSASKAGYAESTEYATVIPGAESFHNVRLYRTSAIINMFAGGRIFRVVLILCLIVAYIYIRKRYRSTRDQDE